jgi:hypothetical protein
MPRGERKKQYLRKPVRERCNIVHNDAVMIMSPAAARVLIVSNTAY